MSTKDKTKKNKKSSSKKKSAPTGISLLNVGPSSKTPALAYKYVPAKSASKRVDYSMPVMLYLTPKQKEGLVKVAQAKGLPLSTFIRETALTMLNAP